MFETALSFDDVLLVPQASAILPKDVQLHSRLSKNLTLNTPLLSAAMDTVTEARLAIRMAQEGGLGVIHRNMSIENQSKEVLKVKKSESGMVSDPVCIKPDQTVQEAVNMMRYYNISGIPVTDGKVLKGILTNRDLQFENNLQQKVSDIMTTDVVTSGKGTSLDQAKELLHKHRIEKLPIVNDSNELIGLITIRDIKKALQFPDASKDAQARLLVAAAIGTGADSTQRAQALCEAGVDVLVLDTAHGHSEKVIAAAKALKSSMPGSVDLIAGNIATANAAHALMDAGVDALKVGIGPGSICTTRIIAGIGVPQLTAILNVAKVAQKKNIPVIADGGIKFSGDAIKALAAGASTVMMGSMFAGTDEAPGEQVLYQGRTYKSYRGMGSVGAMKGGSADRYFQDQMTAEYKLVPEGIEGKVPYKGSLSSVIHQMVGGIKAGMGYVGAKDVADLHEKAEFVRITQSGLRESHVHDVSISKETPNYQRV